MMLPPRPKDDAQPQRSKPVASRTPGEDDDQIPF
jgi:hypothetical protein